MRLRWFFEAAGVALLVSFPYFAELMFPGDIALYHHHLYFRTLIEGLFLAVFVTFLLTAGTITYFHYRFASRPRAVARAALTSIVILRLVDSILMVFGHWYSNLNPAVSDVIVSPHFVTAALFFLSLWYFRVSLVVGVAVLAWWKPCWTDPCVKGVRIGLAAFAFNLIWVLPELAHFAFGLNPVKPFSNAAAMAIPANNQRIVWILLDELSYDQTFDHRAPGLSLPNMDKLRAESTSFSDVQPVGFYTDRIIPSLLSGHTISNIKSNLEGKLFYSDSMSHRWLAFNPRESLFGLAQSDGWRSGVAGWFNPYCRIFESYLTACSWEVGTLVDGLPLEMVGASEDKSAFANASALIPVFVTSLVPHGASVQADRIRSYKKIFNQAENLIRTGQLNFIFIHLPAPHPTGLYDRKTHHFCACGDYIDNLVLADDTLGILLNDIKQTPWSDRTSVIVTSDHSWRVPLWRGGDSWTPEEENLTKGRFDTRPVLMVHFPGQNSGSEIMPPVPEMIEHDMVAAMLQHKMESAADLQSMADAERSQTSTPAMVLTTERP